MSVRKITVEEALEALGQNNIPFLSGSLTQISQRMIGGVYVNASACALGQCAINLGVDEVQLQDQLSHIKTVKGESLSHAIIGYNDTYKYSPDKVAGLVRQQLTTAQLAQAIEVESKFSVTVLKGS